MQTFHTTIPGYRLNEYLVVIPPNDELRKRISEVRAGFNEKFRPAMPLTARPHLALARFVGMVMNEEKIENRLRHIALAQAPFKIELKDYGSFPSHTIYINVATRLPVQELVRQIKTAQKLMKADPDHSPHFIAEPFIPVARKLLPWQYEKGWQEYAHEHFTAKLIADGMLLLKRPVGGKNYQVAARFDFMNMPVNTRQGELFF